MAGQYHGEVLLCDFMVKRSQNRSRLTVSINYKSRWFVLHPEVLRYCDGSLHGGVGKEKNRVDLNSVLAIEEVDGVVLKPNTFQIVYTDPGNQSRCTLYIVAGSSEKRKEWIDALRSACDKCSVSWESMYHPGVWISGHFSCCDQSEKQAPGCQAAFSEKREVNKSFSMGNNGFSPISMLADRIRSPDKPAKPLPSLPKKAPPPAPKKGPVFISLYSFQSAEDSDLSLVEGEELEIIDDSKPNWWLAKNKKGEKGYVPANYIQKVTTSGIERESWYRQGISRAECEGILREDGNEGCFLVRDSSQEGRYTLSVYTKEVHSRDGTPGAVRHYHIRENSLGKYYLTEKHAYTNIPDLIHYHRHDSAGLVVRLRTEPKDRSRIQPATAGFGHDKWEIDPSELDIGGILGKGQFGEVRKAKWQHRKDVAVKTMQEGAMSEQDFIDEAKTMKQLQHKNLVQLYGVCTKRRPIYIVCEFMSHGSLLSYLKRHRSSVSKQKDKLLGMCVQVAYGMEYLESKGFIHRDLAARNCLVGDNYIVKVADFGLARFVLDDEYTSSLGAKFPIKWAPPEVLGYSKFSSKSDVWSFGILMWEIFTGGDMPYGMKRNPQVVEDVSRGYRLSKPTHCHECIYIVMASCWDHSPELRPPFKQLLYDLEKIQEDGDYF